MRWNEKLKQFRESKNLSQTEFGKLFGESQKVISNYELGKNNPPIDLILRIANYYQISLDYLLGRYD